MVNEFNVIVVMNEAIFFKIDKSDAYQMIYLKEKINRVFWRNLK